MSPISSVPCAECGSCFDTLEEALQIAESEVRILLHEKQELEFRLTDLSQRQLNVIGVLDKYDDDPDHEVFLVLIRAALKMGDD